MNKPAVQTLGVFLLLGLSFLLHSCIRSSIYTSTFSTRGITSPPVIRVALTEEAEHEVTSARISFDGAWKLMNPDGEPIHQSAEPVSAKIRSRPDGRIVFGDVDTQLRAVRIAPGSGTVMKAYGRAYRGELYVFVRPGSKRVVVCNEVTLEDYVRGVLSAEMPVNYAESALQAQSVAARTYALHQMMSRQLRTRWGFDVFDDTRSQVYRGRVAEHPVTDAVVARTRGVVLTWKGRIFKTYFSNTCGGETESAETVFDDPAIEPLSGTTCGFCTESRFYNWGPVVLPLEDAAEKLFPRDPTAVIRTVQIMEKTDAGRAVAIEVRLNGDRTEVVSGSDFRRRLNRGVSIQSRNRVRSTRMTVEVTDKSLRVYGRGWGHGVGLCQEGARGMARARRSGSEILEYYYPGSKQHQMY